MKSHLLSALRVSVTLFALFLASCAEPELSEQSFPLTSSETSGTISSPAPPGDILLAAGDTLTIDVWGQKELSKQLTLDAVGNIYFPFIGKVQAYGLTIEQLQNTLTNKLSLYFVTPEVTITPQDLAGQQYFILGEITSPGKQTIKVQTAVIEAVATAGGPTKDAGDTVILLRKQEDKLLIISIPLQYSNLTENHIPSLTMQVRAEDILYLAPSKIANVEKFMIRLNNILNPILALERGILFWPELVKAINGSSSEQQVLIPVQ